MLQLTTYLFGIDSLHSNPVIYRGLISAKLIFVEIKLGFISGVLSLTSVLSAQDIKLGFISL